LTELELELVSQNSQLVGTEIVREVGYVVY